MNLYLLFVIFYSNILTSDQALWLELYSKAEDRVLSTCRVFVPLVNDVMEAWHELVKVWLSTILNVFDTLELGCGKCRHRTPIKIQKQKYVTCSLLEMAVSKSLTPGLIYPKNYNKRG